MLVFLSILVFLFPNWDYRLVQPISEASEILAQGGLIPKNSLPVNIKIIVQKKLMLDGAEKNGVCDMNTDTIWINERTLYNNQHSWKMNELMTHELGHCWLRL